MPPPKKKLTLKCHAEKGKKPTSSLQPSFPTALELQAANPGSNFYRPTEQKNDSLDNAFTDSSRRLDKRRDQKDKDANSKTKRFKVSSEQNKKSISTAKGPSSRSSTLPFPTCSPPTSRRRVQPSTPSSSFLDALFRRELGLLTHMHKHFLEPLSALCVDRLPLNLPAVIQEGDEALNAPRRGFPAPLTRFRELLKSSQGRPRLLYHPLYSERREGEGFAIVSRPVEGGANQSGTALGSDAFLVGPYIGPDDTLYEVPYYLSVRVKTAAGSLPVMDVSPPQTVMAPELYPRVPEQRHDTAYQSPPEKRMVMAVVPGLLGPQRAIQTVVEEESRRGPPARPRPDIVNQILREIPKLSTCAFTGIHALIIESTASGTEQSSQQPPSSPPPPPPPAATSSSIRGNRRGRVSGNSAPSSLPPPSRREQQIRLRYGFNMLPELNEANPLINSFPPLLYARNFRTPRSIHRLVPNGHCLPAQGWPWPAPGALELERSPYLKQISIARGGEGGENRQEEGDQEKVRGDYADYLRRLTFSACQRKLAIADLGGK